MSLASGTDSRIGKNYLSAGPGFGGSCFQKDILNLVYLCKFYGLDQVATYWEQVILLNTWQKKRISEILINKFFGTVASKKICLLGFSFKPFTNDTRESASIFIAKDLIDNGAHVVIHDPQVKKNQMVKIPKKTREDLEYFEVLRQCSSFAITPLGKEACLSILPLTEEYSLPILF